MLSSPYGRARPRLAHTACDGRSANDRRASRLLAALALSAGGLFLGTTATPAATGLAAAAAADGQRLGTAGPKATLSRSRDRDGDGTPNRRDRNVDGDGELNAHDRDIDGDGRPNGRDRDIDGDGAPNAVDRDIDGDGATNRRDSDMDCDRVPNRFDRDIDGDGRRNYRDPDSDADGVSTSARLPRKVRLPKTFFGVSAPQAWASTGRARMAELRQIAGTRVGTLRQTFEWSRIEIAPGVYDYGAYDSFVGDAARSGLTVQPVLFDPPAFHSARPPAGAQRGTYPPRNASQLAALAVRLVRRYGPRGSFWAGNPSTPRRPIRAWQVWNEPHLRAYWPTGPDPAAYAALLRVVAGAIRGADRGAEVIAGGISRSAIGMPLGTFLAGLYRAGGRGTFDSLAIHPYAPAADQVYQILRRVRRIAARHGDRRVPIHVTELGWATAGPRSPFRTGYKGQAELVGRTWATLVRRRAKLRLRSLTYFSWRDLPPYAPLYQDFYGLHTGLVGRNGSTKPSHARFARAVRRMTARK